MTNSDAEARFVSQFVDAVGVVVQLEEKCGGIGHVHEVVVYWVKPFQNIGNLIIMSRFNVPSQCVSVSLWISPTCDIKYSLVHGFKWLSEHLSTEDLLLLVWEGQSECELLGIAQVVPLFWGVAVSAGDSLFVFCKLGITVLINIYKAKCPSLFISKLVSLLKWFSEYRHDVVGHVGVRVIPGVVVLVRVVDVLAPSCQQVVVGVWGQVVEHWDVLEAFHGVVAVVVWGV